MSKRIRPALLLSGLVLGLLTTAGIAWWAAFLHDASQLAPAGLEADARGMEILQKGERVWMVTELHKPAMTVWYATSTDEEAPAQAFAWEQDLTPRWLERRLEKSPGSGVLPETFVAVGWPMRSFQRGWSMQSFDQLTVAPNGQAELPADARPWRPIWIGLFIDGSVFALIWLLLLAASRHLLVCGRRHESHSHGAAEVSD